MKAIHYFILAALAAVTTITSAPAFERPMHRANQHLTEIFGDAPLSPEQKEKVRAVLKSHRAEIRAVRKKSEDARRALAEASKASDSAATLRAANQVGDAARDRALLRARIESEIRPILTPEQSKRLDAARAEFWHRADAAVASGSNS